MLFRISPLWWPVLLIFSPVIAIFITIRNKKFLKNKVIAKKSNENRINSAKILDLPELEYLELTVIVDEKTEDGFIGDAGVSYHFKSNLGSLLFDVGFGEERPAFSHNIKKLNIDLNLSDAFAISHLHLDHMGGIAAAKNKKIIIPGNIEKNKICYIPDEAYSDQAQCEIIDSPRIIKAGIGTTGPLARSLFFFGLTEEQALVARIKGKGLVVFTGCGHPTVGVILEMVKKISNEPLYALGGGLHFPITEGRGNRIGIKFQTIVGTGKPPWQRIKDKEMYNTIDEINKVNPEKVFLSAHDSCDYALKTMKEKLTAETSVLKAGATYKF
ncbi:MAG: MBL fold metallo-hydrolase [Desulfobacterales bacterium]|nr:MBL fold metallo-hydrolase [Desulfobacterales bacterium]MCP4158484.1 MBL fold metallo-hydrolase [Deltaproteobacteria bacterium]